jgi:serine/threonine protein kinase
VAAIKVIEMEEGEDLDDVLIEIEILKDTRHPNIVSYYNSYIDTDAQELWVLFPFSLDVSLLGRSMHLCISPCF